MLVQLFVHVVGSLSVGKHCKHSHVTMYSSINILPCAFKPSFPFFLRQWTTLSQQWGSFLLGGVHQRFHFHVERV